MVMHGINNLKIDLKRKKSERIKKKNLLEIVLYCIVLLNEASNDVQVKKSSIYMSEYSFYRSISSIN